MYFMVLIASDFFQIAQWDLWGWFESISDVGNSIFKIN